MMIPKNNGLTQEQEPRLPSSPLLLGMAGRKRAQPAVATQTPPPQGGAPAPQTPVNTQRAQAPSGGGGSWTPPVLAPAQQQHYQPGTLWQGSQGPTAQVAPTTGQHSQHGPRGGVSVQGSASALPGGALSDQRGNGGMPGQGQAQGGVAALGAPRNISNGTAPGQQGGFGTSSSGLGGTSPLQQGQQQQQQKQPASQGAPPDFVSYWTQQLTRPETGDHYAIRVDGQGNIIGGQNGNENFGNINDPNSWKYDIKQFIEDQATLDPNVWGSYQSQSAKEPESNLLDQLPQISEEFNRDYLDSSNAAIRGQVSRNQGLSLQRSANAGARAGMTPDAMLGRTADTANQFGLQQNQLVAQNEMQVYAQHHADMSQQWRDRVNAVMALYYDAQDDETRAELWQQAQVASAQARSHDERMARLQAELNAPNALDYIFGGFGAAGDVVTGGIYSGIIPSPFDNSQRGRGGY